MFFCRRRFVRPSARSTGLMGKLKDGPTDGWTNGRMEKRTFEASVCPSVRLSNDSRGYRIEIYVFDGPITRPDPKPEIGDIWKRS